jgi:hypothetical protein
MQQILCNVCMDMWNTFTIIFYIFKIYLRGEINHVNC